MVAMLSVLQPVIYIQISPNRLTLKNLKTGETIAEIPEVAISAPPKRRVLAVGPQARQAAKASPGAEVVNPFAHPRTLISDFTAAEMLVKHQVRRILGNSIFFLAPRIVIHPLGSPEGGFTQIEHRAIHELAISAGASAAWIRTGHPLTDDEITQVVTGKLEP
ncbi:MAG: rod shape-determining protein [Methylobacillus sp.]|jgi:rod shape-determining protein MreB|nr:rod shape-determining protein [Methylobacillus sp.]